MHTSEFISLMNPPNSGRASLALRGKVSVCCIRLSTGDSPDSLDSQIKT